MKRFDLPGFLPTETRRAFVEDIIRTNEDYPCVLLVHFAGETTSSTFETREEIERYLAAMTS